ncbi:hypothetical protein ACIQUW_33025 [Streptomyces sp. NPDC101117]|uniref:hypothetical protein n=1 Tax=Streptomyces sp. NPDC101117 TaxID=3366108 RepID=UPI0037F4B8DB
MTSKTRYPCPTDQKKRYATSEAAESAARRSQIGIGAPLYPYICVCTWWHLSKQKPDTIPTDATADSKDVYRLQVQSDAAFRETVSNDARGKLDMNDRIALRQPGNLLRWNDTLKELRADINTQLTERRTDNSLHAYDWRRRAEGFRDSLTIRLQECRDLRAQHIQNTQQQRAAEQPEDQAVIEARRQAAVAANTARRKANAEDLDRRLDAHGVPSHINKDLRRQAGENAIQRLIDAHGLEFTRYLAEECAAIGVELPKRVRKYIADDLAQTA